MPPMFHSPPEQAQVQEQNHSIRTAAAWQLCVLRLLCTGYVSHRGLFLIRFLIFFTFISSCIYLGCWRPSAMTLSRAPKNQTSYLDIELLVADNWLLAAGNPSSALLALFHLNLFYKWECIKPHQPFESHNMISSFLLYNHIDNYAKHGQETLSLWNHLRWYISALYLAAMKRRKATAAWNCHLHIETAVFSIII